MQGIPGSTLDPNHPTPHPNSVVPQSGASVWTTLLPRGYHQPPQVSQIEVELSTPPPLGWVYRLGVDNLSEIGNLSAASR